MSSEINLSNNEVVETVHYPNQTQDTTHIREQIAGIEKEMGNFNLGSSSHTDELKELGSNPVWEHFESLQGEDGTEWAVCNYCRKKLVGSINIGTKHLQNHFKRCAEKSKIGGRDGDHKPAELGNRLENPIRVIEYQLVDQLLKSLDTESMDIDNGDTSLLDSIKTDDQIIQLYEEEKERYGTYLKDLSSRLCLSIHKYGQYILFLIHFIDGDWDMTEQIISIKKIEEDSNILRCLEDVLLEWQIDKNISSIIDSRRWEKDDVEYVERFNEMKSWFTGRGSLPFAGKLLCTDSLNNLHSEYQKLRHLLADNVLERISQIFEYVQGAFSKEQNFQIAIERAKSLGKEVTVAVIDKKVYYDINECLITAIGYKEAFFELENVDTEFKWRNLTEGEWDQAVALNNSYEELSDGFTVNVAANRDFILLCELYTRSLLLLEIDLFFGYSEEFFNWFLNIMFEYWSENNLVVAAAAVLDPRFKLDIVQYWYKKIYGCEWETQLTLFEEYFTDVYNEYARLDFRGRQRPYDSSISHKMLDPSGRPCKSSNHLEDVSLRKSELDLYLKEVKFPSIESFDVLKWWHVNKQYFPTLARMARDFLAINLKAEISGSLWYLFQHATDYFHSDMVRKAIIYNCWKVVE